MHWFKKRLAQLKYKIFFKNRLSIQKNSNQLDDIIDINQLPEQLATGFQFTEGPVWMQSQGILLFSDIPGNAIYKYSPGIGYSIYRNHSNNSNGLTLDHDGRLIACEHMTRQVTRTEKDGTLVVLCDKYNGSCLNSPNDVIVKSDGTIYFTDPTYGIDSQDQEQPVQGVYQYDPKSEKLILIIDNLKSPNGLVFSPDEKKLYVNDSHQDIQKIYTFELVANGLVDNQNLFFDLKSKKPGAPDGMKIDIHGNLFCAGPGGIWIFSSDNQHLGTIILPEIPSNCAWGSPDLRTLYITAQTSLYAVRTKIPGRLVGAINI